MLNKYFKVGLDCSSQRACLTIGFLECLFVFLFNFRCCFLSFIDSYQTDVCCTALILHAWSQPEKLIMLDQLVNNCVFVLLSTLLLLLISLM